METLTKLERGSMVLPTAGPVLSVKNLQAEYTAESGNVARRGWCQCGKNGEVSGLTVRSGCGKSTISKRDHAAPPDPAKITRIASSSPREIPVSTGRGRTATYTRSAPRSVAMVFQSTMNSMNTVMTIGDQIVDVFTTHEEMWGQAAREHAVELLGSLFDIKPGPPQVLPAPSSPANASAGGEIALALKPFSPDHGRTHRCSWTWWFRRKSCAQIKELEQRDGGLQVVFHHPRHLTHGRALPPHGCDVCRKAGQVAPSKTMLDNPLHPYTNALMDEGPPLTGPRVELIGIPDGPRSDAILPRGAAWGAMDPPRAVEPPLLSGAENQRAAVLVPGYVVPRERSRR